MIFLIGVSVVYFFTLTFSIIFVCKNEKLASIYCFIAYMKIFSDVQGRIFF